MKNRTLLIFLSFLILLFAGLSSYFYFSGKERIIFEEFVPSKAKFYASPSGSDQNNGLSEKTPFFTIQKALDLAQPGDVIRLAEGTYAQDIRSIRDGSEKNPIVLTGSPSSVLKGNGNPRIIEINHDYITLNNFTVDGLTGDPGKKSSYRDKLIYVQGKENKLGVTGLRILKMNLRNSGGECVRLRYFAQKNELAENKITNCGAYDFRLGGKGKNGEGIYIGTAPEQRDDGKNPTDGSDHSDGNWIHDNIIDTQGNECIDIKEGSSKNIVEKNTCTGQKDEDSGGLDSRGNENIFRNNLSYGNAGAGIRLGGDKKTDGTSNDIYGNTFKENAKGGIKIMRSPQGKICGNKFIDNEGGDFTGEYTDDFENEDC